MHWWESWVIAHWLFCYSNWDSKRHVFLWFHNLFFLLQIHFKVVIYCTCGDWGRQSVSVLGYVHPKFVCCICWKTLLTYVHQPFPQDSNYPTEVKRVSCCSLSGRYMLVYLLLVSYGTEWKTKLVVTYTVKIMYIARKILHFFTCHCSGLSR